MACIHRSRTLCIRDIHNNNYFHRAQASTLRCGPVRLLYVPVKSLEWKCIQDFLASKPVRFIAHMTHQMKLQRIQMKLQRIQHSLTAIIQVPFRSRRTYFVFVLSSPIQISPAISQLFYTVKELTRSERIVCHPVICADSTNAAARLINPATKGRTTFTCDSPFLPAFL